MTEWAIANRTVVPEEDASQGPNVIGGKIYRVDRIQGGQIYVYCEDGTVRRDGAGDLRLLSPLELLARQVDAE